MQENGEHTNHLPILDDLRYNKAECAVYIKAVHRICSSQIMNLLLQRPLLSHRIIHGPKLCPFKLTISQTIKDINRFISYVYNRN